MNSENTLRDSDASLVDLRQRSQLSAQVFWAIALLGPVPFVLAPFLAGLSRIDSLPVYVFSLCAWSAALFTFLSIVRSRWDKISLFPRTRPSLLLAMAGIACQVCAVCLLSIPTALLGWILLAGAWLATHTSSQQGKRSNLLNLWPALCTLAPIPSIAATKLDQAYQQLLSHTVTLGLDSLGVPFHREHGQFEFARFALSVDEGLVNSPFIGWMLCVACLVFSWLRRPMILLPAYIGAAILWVFGMHMVQLCTIGFLRRAYQIDVGTGWLFVLLNVATLMLAIGLIFSTDRCLRILFMPVPTDSSPGFLNPLSRMWNRMLLPLAADNYRKA